MPNKPTRIAIVGGGPTAVYTLKNLLQKSERLEVTIFEAGSVAGCGIPYSEQHNTADMMANITSVEIPPVLTSLADWIRAADRSLLRRFGIEREKVGDRDFYPRILIGSYYIDQLSRMIQGAAAAGHTISVKSQTRVTDIQPHGTRFEVFFADDAGSARERFDSVVIATGHLTDVEPSQPRPGLYRSPYPSQELKLGRDRACLVLGSSLSAIDAVVALASRYGRFEGEGNDLCFHPRGGEKLRLVMASRKGVLPDADFYYPIPEEPLLIFTPARLKALQKSGKTGFLAKAVKLFRQQLEADDPEFYRSLTIKRFTPESFTKAYFASRTARRGFAAIKENLEESQRNYRDRRIVMWRYTLMRAHEVFGEVVPFLDRRDLTRFRRYLAPVFADAYGCVPHLSVQRILALHRAGCLDLVALGNKGTIRYGAGLFTLSRDGEEQTFETFVDARGQEMASIADLGFHRLDEALETQDFLRRSRHEREDDQFRIPLREQLNPDIFCISIPVMMKRYPFAQGLVACSDAAELVAKAI